MSDNYRDRLSMTMLTNLERVHLIDYRSDFNFDSLLPRSVKHLILTSSSYNLVANDLFLGVFRFPLLETLSLPRRFDITSQLLGLIGSQLPLLTTLIIPRD